MVYATKEFYQESYLLGRKPKLPLSEFEYWEQSARRYVDEFTFNRITEDVLATYSQQIGQCTCELAEFLYTNEGYENKQSESILGRSASYRVGTEYTILRRHLGMTGLMYRGSAYVAEGSS